MMIQNCEDTQHSIQGTHGSGKWGILAEGRQLQFLVNGLGSTLQYYNLNISYLINLKCLLFIKKLFLLTKEYFDKDGRYLRDLLNWNWNRLPIRQATIRRLQGCQNNEVGSGKMQTENKYQVIMPAFISKKSNDVYSIFLFSFDFSEI